MSDNLQGMAAGRVERLQPGEYLENPDGSKSTERSITVNDARLNEGRATNIPTIWKVDGEILSLGEDDEGQARAVDYAIQSGGTFPGFGSVDEAVAAAAARSSAGGRFADADSGGAGGAGFKSPRGRGVLAGAGVRERSSENDLSGQYGVYRQKFSADALIGRARDRVSAANASPGDGAGGVPGDGAGGVPGDGAGGVPGAGLSSPEIETRALSDGRFGAFVDGIMVAGGATAAEARAAAAADDAEGSILDTAGDVAADIGGGVVEAPRQIGGGLATGAREMLQALDDLAGWLNENVADLTLPSSGVDALDNPIRAAADAIPEGDPARTVTGGILNGVAQFLAGFGVAGKALKAAGVAAKATRGGQAANAMAKGAISDAFAFDPDDKNLSDLLREHTELNDPVTGYLASDPGDADAEKRFKRALEGLGLGVAADGFFHAVRAYRARRLAKSEGVADGAQPSPDAARQSVRDRYGEVSDADLGLNRDAPIFEVRAAPDAQPAGQRFGEGNARYGSVGDTEFLRLADGSFGLGFIGDDVAEKADTVAGEIRLSHGRHDTATGRGIGEVHIEAQRGDAIREAGYADAAEFVAEVAGGFNQVWSGHSGRLLLAKANGKSKTAIVELVPSADGNYYTVVSGGLYRQTYLKGGKRKLLWEGERRSTIAGVADPLQRGGQSGENVTYRGAEIDPDAILLTPDASVVAGVDVPEAGRRVFINFERIDTGEDVKSLIGQMAEAFSDNIKAGARGRQSHAETARLADELGMTVDDLLQRRQGQPFNAEQALAARRLWAASAEKLMTAARRASSPNAGDVDQFLFRRLMTVHAAIQAEVIGARTETARALAAWKIPAGGGIERARAIQQAMESSGGRDMSAEMAKRIAKLAEQGVSLAGLGAAARRGFAAKTMDAVRESYVLGLLWSPKTHLVNMGSNLAVAFQQIMERGVASRLSSAAGREAGDGVANGEAVAMAFGMVTSLRDAFRLAGRAVRTGDTGASLQKIDLPRPRAISSEAFEIASDTGLGRAVDFIGNATRIPGRLLSGEDEFFKTIGYRAELHAQALRKAVSEGHKGGALYERIGEIVADPPEYIRISSADAALYNTFTNTPGEWVRSLMGVRNAGDFNPTFVVLPFLRTPANILRYTFERSPVAPLVGQWRADIAAGGARRDIALARMATGSAIMALAADYAYSGFVSGSGPAQPEKRQALERLGWQRNSVYIGGNWYSYQRTDPFGMLMGFAADMSELVKRAEIDPEELDELTEILGGAVAAASDNVIDKTYFEGVSRIFETFEDPDRFLPDYINQQVTGFIPATTLMGTVKNAVDPVSRDYNSPWEAVQSRLAMFSAKLPPRRDLWGRPRRLDEVYGRGYGVVSPIRVSEVKDNPVDMEILRLGVGLRRITKKTGFGGVDVNLRDYPRAYDDYVRLAGNDLPHPVWEMGAMDFLNAVVSGKHQMSQVYALYSDGPDGGKADFIRKTISEYRRLARQQIIADPEHRALRDLVNDKRAADNAANMDALTGDGLSGMLQRFAPQSSGPLLPPPAAPSANGAAGGMSPNRSGASPSRGRASAPARVGAITTPAEVPARGQSSSSGAPPRLR